VTYLADAPVGEHRPDHVDHDRASIVSRPHGVVGNRKDAPNDQLGTLSFSAHLDRPYRGGIGLGQGRACHEPQWDQDQAQSPHNGVPSPHGLVMLIIVVVWGH
jgi:hypothetical protein